MRHDQQRDDTSSFGAPATELLKPRNAAALLGITPYTLRSLDIKPVPVKGRGHGRRRHVLYRLGDLEAFVRGGGRS